MRFEYPRAGWAGWLAGWLAGLHGGCLIWLRLADADMQLATRHKLGSSRSQPSSGRAQVEIWKSPG